LQGYFKFATFCLGPTRGIPKRSARRLRFSSSGSFEEKLLSAEGVGVAVVIATGAGLGGAFAGEAGALGTTVFVVAPMSGWPL